MLDMNENAISIKNFSLSFGKKKIIDDLSFEIKKGEVFGLLGSNGSGKTSIIRTLLGLYQADSGELLINGEVFAPGKKILSLRPLDSINFSSSFLRLPSPYITSV